jgi:hypothetical protein
MKPRDPKSFEGLLQKKLAEHRAEPPPNLWAKIERETAPQKLRFLARRLNHNLHWLNLAATVLLVLVVLFFLYPPQNKSLNLPLPKLNTPLQQQLKGVPDSLDSLKKLFHLQTKTKPTHEKVH